MNKAHHAAVAAWATLVAVTFSPSSAQEQPAKWTWPSRAKVHDLTPPDSPFNWGQAKAGAKLPPLELTTSKGDSFDLNAAISKKPTVLVLYQGYF